MRSTMSEMPSFPDAALGYPPPSVEYNAQNIQNLIAHKLDTVIHRRLARAHQYHRSMEDAFVFHGQRNESGNSTSVLPLFVTLSVPAGGLGNFMFWTAAVVGVARKNNRVRTLFISSFSGFYRVPELGLQFFGPVTSIQYHCYEMTVFVWESKHDIETAEALGRLAEFSTFTNMSAQFVFRSQF